MESIKALDTVFLDKPANCIEFWPVDRRYFVVGTYVLDEPTSTNVATTVQADIDILDSGSHSPRNDVDVNTSDPPPHPDLPQTRSGSLLLYRVDGNSM